ncbi:CDP-alcohol phosphatidyltransferase family protein [Falsirhodobacter halotolerans]|uniref:CDP-alcohol phosphatidyltransferase family protein n=1 Tax=Falsirhodobacter halotolerans TaxID=1146892 RepID=UPI001FD1C063|nr:phosphatidylcholine/phosphatidylserine synthase [Falsirhodobacter halotolerans]MCJ8140773.1 phosphatidylcholine/phosphatidylserine synthase [Falsirhodobacter halotolerans]
MAAPRAPRLSLSRLVPNLLTLAAICAGLTSIRFAIEGRVDQAIGLIILAAVLDGMDGRLARILKSESAIGAELDSLADFLNFGVATGLLVFFTLLSAETGLGWIAVLIYVICCVMRLARFNVGSKTPDPDAIPGYFTGVPSPAGALLALMPIAVDRAFPGMTPTSGVIVAFWLIFVGWLLISHIPTPSLKLVRLRRDRMHYIFVGMIAAGAILFTWPWHALVALNLLYLGVVLWSFSRRQRRGPKRRPDET